MNRLNGLTCYVSFPIEFGNKRNTERTEYLMDMLKNTYKLRVVNPKKISFNGLCEIIDREGFLKNKTEYICSKMKMIVKTDLKCVDVSNLLIAYLPKDIRTTGCIHEIIMADIEKKPTLILCEDGIENIPLWLFGILKPEYFFKSMNDLREYLDKINNTEDLYSISDERWSYTLSIFDQINN